MSSSLTFGGAGFSLYAATTISSNVVRITFTQIPLQASSVGVNDALNPANWTVSGPVTDLISQIAVVASDPYSVDIVFASSLALGTWTIAGATAIQTSTAVPLASPNSVTFAVTTGGTASDLNPGATNDSASDIIRQHFNPFLKGPTWNALIAGLSYSDDINATNAQLAQKQLYKISASGKYLDILASADGTVRPASVGFSDETFRQLAIKAPAKVTSKALRDILAIYYGQDQSSAFVDTGLYAPFALQDGQTLDLLIDGLDTVRVTFRYANASLLGQATALEVAAVISKALYDAGSNATAVVQFDSSINANRVRIYSGSLGLKSFVQVVGGTAQPFLQFPSLINVYGTFTSALWGFSTTAGVTQMQRSAASSTDMDTSLVQAGDYVVVGTTAGLGVSGVYSVAKVGIQWVTGNYVQTITFAGPAPVLGGTYTQTTALGYTFFRPTKAYIKNDANGVFISQTARNSLEINLPATSKAVTRGVLTASYGNVNNTVPITRLVRNATGLVTVTTATAHNLETGTQAYISDFAPAASYPWIAPGKAGQVWGPVTGPDVTTGAISDYVRNFPGVAKLSSGDILIAGGWADVGGTPETASAKCVRLISSSISTVADASDAVGASYKTFTWGAVPNMSTARIEFGLTNMVGAHAFKALAVGGINGTTVANSTEIYNTLTNTWSAGPVLPKDFASGINKGKFCHQQVALNDGRIWIGGGCSATNEAVNSVFLYSPDSNAMGYPKSLVSSGVGNLKKARASFKAVKLNDGRVFVAGGRLMGQLADLTDLSLFNYWGFDETSGTTFTSPTAAGAVLTVTGTANSVLGKIKNARSFTNTSYANGPGGPGTSSILAAGNWTVDCWVTSWAASKAIFTFGDTAAGTASNDNTLCQIGINSSSQFFASWQYGSGTVVTVATSSNPFPTGLTTYAHLVATCARQPSGFVTCTLYINGQVQALTTGLNGPSGGGGGSYWVAKDPKPGTTLGTFLGGIDDLKVWYRPLTQYDVQKVFLAGLGDNPAWTDVRFIPKSTDVTDTCEIWDPATETASYTTPMALARSDFESIVLDDGRVLTMGGLGYCKSQPATEPQSLFSDPWDVPAAGFVWPAQGLADCEIYDPANQTVTKISSMKMPRYKFWAVKIPGKNKILVGGGITPYTGYPANYPSETGAWEVLDLATMKWSMAPWPSATLYNHTWGFSDGSGWAFLGGGDVSLLGNGNSFKNVTVIAPGNGDTIAAGGINGLYPVTALDALNFTYQSPIKAYTNSHGSLAGNLPISSTSGVFGYDVARSGGWNATTATRTANFTVLAITNPAAYKVFPFKVGDQVFFNSDNASFPSGMKTIVSVGVNTITYADTGANIGPITISGLVNPQVGFGTSLEVQAYPNTTNVGPYVWDPTNYSLAAGVSVLTTALGKDISYRTFDIAAPSNVFDGPGFIVFDFAGPLQSAPIPYLETFPNGTGGFTVLVDNYIPKASIPAGTSVSTVYNINPTQPAAQSGYFYMTDSSAGRIFAEAQLRSSIAAGETLKINVGYPGDRGLGGAGAANSQKKWVWGN